MLDIYKMLLDLERGITMRECDYFITYIDSLDKHIHDEREKVTAEIKHAIKGLSGDDEAELISGFEDEIEQVNRFNPTIFYHSAFTAIHTLIEKKLKSIAKRTIDTHELEAEKNDDLKSILKEIKKYKSLSDFHDKFNVITEFQKLRNAFAHYNGEWIKEKDYDIIKQTLSKYDSLEFEDEKRTVTIKDSKILTFYTNHIKDLINTLCRYLVST